MQTMIPFSRLISQSMTLPFRCPNEISCLVTSSLPPILPSILPFRPNIPPPIRLVTEKEQVDLLRVCQLSEKCCCCAEMVVY